MWADGWWLAVPRAGDPRVVVRMSAQGHAGLVAAAESAGVAVGALVRECVERYAVLVAREVGDGRLALRAANGRRDGASGPLAVTPASPHPAPRSREEAAAVGVARAEAFRRMAERRG